MSFRWKISSVGHVLQTDTVHTATAAVASTSGHANFFGSLLRDTLGNALNYTTSIVTTDEVQMSLFCTAIVMPATALLLRSLVRDIKPDEIIAIKDRIKIEEDREKGNYITEEQMAKIRNASSVLGLSVSNVVRRLDFGRESFIPRSLENITVHEGKILLEMLDKEKRIRDSSILEKGQA